MMIQRGCFRKDASKGIYLPPIPFIFKKPLEIEIGAAWF
jgi:hypothetical protein